jgi:hypothetical protein
MASTRNRNTPEDYGRRLREHRDQLHYYSYDTAPYFARPETTYFAGDGLVGMKASYRYLSDNYCDVESYLFGIGSTNLVNPKPAFHAEIKQLKSLNMIDKSPKIMPEPFVYLVDQRALART